MQNSCIYGILGIEITIAVNTLQVLPERTEELVTVSDRILAGYGIRPGGT